MQHIAIVCMYVCKNCADQNQFLNPFALNIDTRNNYGCMYVWVTFACTTNNDYDKGSLRILSWSVLFEQGSLVH